MRRKTLILIASRFLAPPLLLAASLSALSCNRQPDPVTGQGAAPARTSQSRPEASSAPLTASPLAPAPSNSASTSASASTDPVTVHDEGHGALDVEYADGTQRHRLRGSTKPNGKRKYTLDNGPEVLEVKAENGSFKVRTPDGRLLWKVKMGADKIKVSDNEENRDPVELRSGARGVLDANKIPIMQRAVIYAELVDRKQ